MRKKKLIIKIDITPNITFSNIIVRKWYRIATEALFAFAQGKYLLHALERCFVIY